MKSAVDFVTEWARTSSDDPMRDYVELLHEYGQLVREECAKHLEMSAEEWRDTTGIPNPDTDFRNSLAEAIDDEAEEIRKLELP